MNKLKSKYQKSKYSNNEHLIIEIDNLSLDTIIHNSYPNESFAGLIPTLLPWLEDKKERQIVWNRILPKEQETITCPILMCPDDLDFWCTIIVVEIKRNNNIIEWSKFGLNVGSSNGLPESIGNKVRWLENISPFSFPLSDYYEMLSPFENELKIDQIKSSIRKWIWETNKNIPSNAIVLNFGIQLIQNEYEIYTSCHSEFYEDHDTWLIDQINNSSIKYYGLGTDSLNLNREDMFKIYKNEIEQQIEFKNIVYPVSIGVITVTFSDGQPVRIK